MQRGSSTSPRRSTHIRWSACSERARHTTRTVLRRVLFENCHRAATCDLVLVFWLQKRIGRASAHAVLLPHHTQKRLKVHNACGWPGSVCCAVEGGNLLPRDNPAASLGSPRVRPRVRACGARPRDASRPTFGASAAPCRRPLLPPSLSRVGAAPQRDTSKTDSDSSQTPP